MDNPPGRSAKLQAALRKLGNPYACEQVFEVETSDAMTAAHDPAVSAYVRVQENPYAWFGVTTGDTERTPNSSVNERNAAPRMSKEQFRATARRIFRGYIPRTENPVLRPHHRDFITRNEDRSSEERASLIAQLSRYDLSDLRAQGQFNRERDALTVDKLIQIEKDALGTSKP
jgi:hypothetical protein